MKNSFNRINKRIRVLFLTYPWIGLNRGGLQAQIEKTASELTELGVEIVFYSPWENQIPNVDLCHMFGIDGSQVYHAERAAKLGKPVIMSSVFNAFASPSWLVGLKVRLSRLVPGMYSDLKRAERMLKLVDCIIALNADEKQLLMQAFEIDQDRFAVIPNGINKHFVDGDPELFARHYGVTDFVLQVASIEQRKNQLNLIKAMAHLPYHLVLIGQATQANDYYLEECKKLATDKVLFTGHIENQNPLLASAFAAARVFVLPSYSEVMPLTVYEAALAGCRIVTSKKVPISELITEYVSSVNPDSPKEIAEAIETEMKLKPTDDLRQAVLSMPNWTDVARQIKHLYENLIAKHSD